MTSRKPPLVALALVLALAACGQKPKPAARPQAARTVTVVVVGPRTIEGGLIASGVLIPREDVAIFSDLTGFRVARVMADEGAWVRAGQPLAQLDDTLLRAQIDQAAAQAAQQRVQAERAEAEAARVNGLDNEGVLSKEQVEARRFAARAARAQARAQEAALRDLRTRQGKMTIRATYGGLVIERNVRPGDPGGNASTPWFRIAKDGQIELAADLSESALAKIRPGVAARVTLADGSQVTGAVRLVSPRVDANTKLGRVRISLPVTASARAGGFARASFTGAAQSRLAVPETAIRYDADGAAVMVVGADNKVTRTAVVTGQHGLGFVELISGPPAGSRVVAKYATMLVNGDAVRPVLAPVAAR
jgi:HlyD family secretion protein